MPRSLRRASKRLKQPNPRQLRQPRAHRQQLKQPVRLRLRNLPQARQRLPAEQPNLPLRPRLLRKFRPSSLRSLLPKSFGRRLLLYRCRLNDEGDPNDEVRQNERPISSSFALPHEFFIRQSGFLKSEGAPCVASDKTFCLLQRGRGPMTWRSQLHLPFQKLTA